MNFGMKVKLKFKEDKKFREYRNVTEIHYNYAAIHSGIRIAFESDIHKTGFTRDIRDIKEFETSLETKKLKEFTNGRFYERRSQ